MIKLSDSTVRQVNSLVVATPQLAAPEHLQPASADGIQAAAEVQGVPQSLDELDVTLVRSFDLSVTAAASLNIPVVGSVTGGMSRRVVVLEHTAFKVLLDGTAKVHYGYAVRFCVTVSKLDSSAKLSLPFLAASAEVGSIQAQWTLQIVGLSGPKIREAILPPTELNVEKFVLAKQSLEKIIAAIGDPTTTFRAAEIERILPEDVRLGLLRAAVAQTYALSSIERGRTLGDARDRLGSDSSAQNDALNDVYRDFAGIQDDQTRPANDVRRRAAEVLGRVRADV